MADRTIIQWHPAFCSAVELTLVRREKPEELLSTLVASGLEVSSNYPGIYHVRGNVLFETQIVVTKDLPPKTHIWLEGFNTEH